MVCGGFSCWLLTVALLNYVYKNCAFEEPACPKGKILPPSEAVLYKPNWISAEFGNKTENNDSFSPEDQVVLRTASQFETIILDCQTEDPFWWTPGMILKLFLQLQNKLNGTEGYPAVPKFWIRLAVSGKPDKPNTSACVELISYAVKNSLSSFQGILIQADQLLNFSAGIDEKIESPEVWNNAESRTIQFWKKFGISRIGLLMDSNSCYDVFGRIPKALLQKFENFYFLDTFTAVETTETLAHVSDSHAYENCTENIKDELKLQYVIFDKANVFGYSYFPICIIDE